MPSRYKSGVILQAKAVNDVGDAQGLVGGQGVHGIDQDGLDARCAHVAAAVV